MDRRYALSWCWLLATAAPAAADELSVPECIDIAARAFRLDALPLTILWRTEAGREGLALRNSDGSEDLGPMQINTVNLPGLARFGIDYDDLRWNHHCANVFAAAFLYQRHLVANRGDVALAMAHYHSRRPAQAYRYLGLVQQAIANERRALAPARPGSSPAGRDRAD